MMRILFVDDEPHLLEGLRRSLRAFRKEWEMAFVTSGEQALAELAAAPFDVVVSDMRMPGMDGAALLARVKQEHPGVVRIVLSGHAEVRAMLAVVNVAHQFLSKPCDAARVRAVIERCARLRARLAEEPLRRLVNGIGQLPPTSGSYEALVRILEDPAAGIERVAAVIEADVALSAKMLQLANSAFFGSGRSVRSVGEAIRSLGTNMVKGFVLSAELFRWSEQAGTVPAAFDLEALQQHSLLTARIAMRLFDEQAQREEAFTAGMLHDVGLLLLAVRRGDELMTLLATCEAEGRGLAAVEREVLGTTHAEIGAFLLDTWGLPSDIVEAVAFHHAPREARGGGFDLVGAVHVADHFASCGMPGSREHPDAAAGLDEELLATLGVADRVPAWRGVAAEQVAALG